MQGFGSCWGPKPSLKDMWTTRNARTYLQPQLQKAVGMSDAARKGDVNLKVCGGVRCGRAAVVLRRASSVRCAV